MKGSTYKCSIHGKYVQEGESKRCPECEYKEYVDHMEHEDEFGEDVEDDTYSNNIRSHLTQYLARG